MSFSLFHSFNVLPFSVGGKLGSIIRLPDAAALPIIVGLYHHQPLWLSVLYHRAALTRSISTRHRFGIGSAAVVCIWPEINGLHGGWESEAP
ncbi:unnamed protein product [Calypogeia fissa]